MLVATTTDELNTIFREDVSDPLAGTDGGATDDDSLWKEREVYRYMSFAVDRVAKDTEGLYRVTQLPVTTGTYIVPISRAVLHICYLRVVSTGLTLEPANAGEALFRQVDDYGEKLTGGSFSHQGPLANYVRDYQRSALILIPGPAKDDALEMQYTATGAVPVDKGMPLPFMDADDQYLVLLWMKKLAYAKQDADTLDLKRSKEFEAEYRDRAADRKQKLESYRRAPSSVAMDWW